MGYGDDDRCEAKICCRIDLAGGWSDVPDFSDEHGGEVINIGIDHFISAYATWPKSGMDLRTRTDLPANTHLGTSASADVAFLAVTLAMVDRLKTDDAGRCELAEKSFRLEGLIGEKGGKQDHYAAAFGGVRHYRFGHRDQPAEVESIESDSGRRRELRDHLLLWYTGLSSSSGGIHSDVWKRYRGGDKGIFEAASQLRDSCGPMHEAICEQRFEKIGELLELNRRLSASIDPRIEPAELTRFFEAAKSGGGWGGKGCGVGGGGCIVVAADPAGRSAIRRELKAIGGYEIDYQIADSVLPEC